MDETDIDCELVCLFLFAYFMFVVVLYHSQLSDFLISSTHTYVFVQGLTCLKRAGVAHRDMSPENLMVHDGNVYIIDLGMCLRIPSLHDDDNGHDIINSSSYHPDERALIAPQTPCGKWYYLSPEVCLSEEPFDGPAVDLWAAGVILFIMLTGIPVSVVVSIVCLFTNQARTYILVLINYLSQTFSHFSHGRNQRCQMRTSN